MSTSILNSVKKVLGLAEDYTAFDPDIVLHINSVFSTLQQLGVGPTEGFEIEGATGTWDSFLGADPRLNNVKTYVSLRVRMLFDPPTTGHHVNAMQAQIQELEWRLNVHMEETIWVDQDPELVEEEV